MSFSKPIGELECRKVLEECWKRELNSTDCFPKEISHWISYQAVMAGVAESYISWPILVCAAYCSRHAQVVIEAPIKKNHTDPLPTLRKKPVVMHKQPLVLYAMVVGRSGKRKFYYLCLSSLIIQHMKLRLFSKLF